MAVVADSLDINFLQLGVATSVVVFTLFVFFKCLYKRPRGELTWKGGQKKGTNKKEKKSNQQVKSATKSRSQSPKVFSAKQTSETKSNPLPKAQTSAVAEEDDWVKVKPTKPQTAQTTKDGSKEKSKKNEAYSKKSQKQSNKKAAKSKNDRIEEQLDDSSGSNSPLKNNYVTPQVTEKPIDDEWQEIPSSKKKKQRARRE